MFPFRKRFLGDKIERSETITDRVREQIMPPRRRLRNELEDDEAIEDNSEEPPAQRTFTGSPYRPLNLSGFGGRPSPQASTSRYVLQTREALSTWR